MEASSRPTARQSGTGAVERSGSVLLQGGPDPPGVESSVASDFVSVHVNRFTDASAAVFSERLSDAHRTGQPVVPVIISSYGGLIDPLLQMHAAVQRSELPVLTYTPDRAMSCGFALLAFGTPGYRFVDPNATLMDHQASYGARGKDAEVVNRLEHMREAMGRFYALIDEACGREPGFFADRWEDLNNLNDYLKPEDVVRLGAVDEIGRPVINYSVDVSWKIQR